MHRQNRPPKAVFSSLKHFLHRQIGHRSRLFIAKTSFASSKSATEVDFPSLKLVLHRQNRPPKSILHRYNKFCIVKIGHRSRFFIAKTSFASSNRPLKSIIASLKRSFASSTSATEVAIISLHRYNKFFASSKSATEVDYSSLKQVLHHQNRPPKSILHRYNKFCIVKIGLRSRLFIAISTLASSKSATEVDFASLK